MVSPGTSLCGTGYILESPRNTVASIGLPGRVCVSDSRRDQSGTAIILVASSQLLSGLLDVGDSALHTHGWCIFTRGDIVVGICPYRPVSIGSVERRAPARCGGGPHTLSDPSTHFCPTSGTTVATQYDIVGGTL